MLPQLFLGLVLIGIGIIVNASKKHQSLREVIETYILGGDQLFMKGAEYSKIVQWLGWPSIVAGFLTLIPSSLYWDIGLILVILLVFYRVRREYQQWQQMRPASSKPQQ